MTTTFTDAFTEAAVAFLEDHTPDSASGGPWVAHAGGSAAIKVTPPGDLYGSSTRKDTSAAGNGAFYPSGVTPGGADYSVSASFKRIGAITANQASQVILARLGTGSTQRDSYGVRWASDVSLTNGTGTWQIVKTDAATWTRTVLASASSVQDFATVGTAHTIRLEVVGTTINVYKDGSGTPIATVTDSGVTRIGVPGIFSAAGLPTSSTSVHIDSFTLDETVSAPANTVAPALTGTAAVGATLSCSTGTWSGAPTFTRQWQRDTNDIVGATGSTYVVQAIDAGHSLACVVTATNGSGSGSATSNVLGIPAAPVFSVAPVITTDGSPSTGETVTCSTGTASGSPTYAYQWYRGASPIGGATTNAYTLAVSDEGANVRCLVTATNGGGSASAFSSNTIVPAVTAPLSDASGLWYYSGGTGNTDPALSIGGARGGTIAANTVSTVFGPIPGTMAQNGGVMFAVLYPRNTHSVTTDPATRVYVAAQPSNVGLSVAVAVPSQAAGVDVPALASRTTAPTGVTWSTEAAFADALVFGDLAAGQARGVYVRLTVTAGTTPTVSDTFTLRVRSETA